MADLAARLLAWSIEHGRHDLPWQQNPTAYSIWVSEIMLQQTQVATVVPYYEAFMQRFPDVATLAAAADDDVLAHWSGLGYYARARNLQKAARRVCSDHGGQLPGTLEELTALPGIGRSTAGAILALAQGQRQPILDGNVKRVLARYCAVEGWAGEAAVGRRLWALAERYTPSERVAEYTQAIMDLGATVCTRSRPRCEACPLQAACAARLAGIEHRLPTPRPKRARPARAVAMLLIRNDAGAVLLERRPPAGVWGGLYSLPEVADRHGAADWSRRHLGVGPRHIETLPPLAHAFTHFDLTITPLLVELDASPRAVAEGTDWVWYRRDDTRRLGLPAPVASLVASLEGPD